MELSSVSPPPTSPTQGDDPCEIDGTSVAIHSVTLLIGLCGLAGNGAVICLLRLKGHTACIFGLAVTDFIFLLFVVPSTLLFLLEDVSCSPIMPLLYVSIVFQLSVLSYYWLLFWLTELSIKKDMGKLCRLCCRWDLPDRLLWVVRGARYLAFFAYLTAVPTVNSLCPSHQLKHCRVALISLFNATLLPIVAPVVISSIITFIKAKRGSQQQRPKKFKIAMILVLLFTLVLSLCHFLHQFGYASVSFQVVFLLACIHMAIKPFIYFLVGMYKRPCSMESLRKALEGIFKEPDGNIASSNDDNRETVAMSPLNPSTAQMENPGTQTEGFPESL